MKIVGLFNPMTEARKARAARQNVGGAMAVATTSPEFLLDRSAWGPERGSEEPTRKRKSRWESADAKETPAEKRKTTLPKNLTPAGMLTLPGGVRVQVPPVLLGLEAYVSHDTRDAEIRELHDELANITHQLVTGRIELPPERERSPSPPPVYDERGKRVNTRDVRMKEKLEKKKIRVIEELLRKDKGFRPPMDYRPQKKRRKIYIPVKEHPGYNFFGLIIGPRGNTQKRMQQQTNTRISIRGKGSIKEGSNRPNPGKNNDEEDDLHVLVEGDKEEDMDKAEELVRKLLKPVDDSSNDHKRAQLRELAAMNGTLRDDEQWLDRLKEEGGTASGDTYRLPEHIQKKVDEQYQRDIAKVRPEEAGKIDQEYSAFLQELGGAPLPGSDHGRPMPRAGLGSRNRDAGDPETKLYVAGLPYSLTSERLREIMEPHGTLVECDVIMDRVTGMNRGFAFVQFSTAEEAQTAIGALDGTFVDGRCLDVRIKGTERPPRAGPRFPPRGRGQYPGGPMPPRQWQGGADRSYGRPPPPERGYGGPPAPYPGGPPPSFPSGPGSWEGQSQPYPGYYGREQPPAPYGQASHGADLRHSAPYGGAPPHTISSQPPPPPGGPGQPPPPPGGLGQPPPPPGGPGQPPPPPGGPGQPPPPPGGPGQPPPPPGGPGQPPLPPGGPGQPLWQPSAESGYAAHSGVEQTVYPRAHDGSAPQHSSSQVYAQHPAPVGAPTPSANNAHGGNNEPKNTLDEEYENFMKDIM